MTRRFTGSNNSRPSQQQILEQKGLESSAEGLTVDTKKAFIGFYPPRIRLVRLIHRARVSWKSAKREIRGFAVSFASKIVFCNSITSFEWRVHENAAAQFEWCCLKTYFTCLFIWLHIRVLFICTNTESYSRGNNFSKVLVVNYTTDETSSIK